MIKALFSGSIRRQGGSSQAPLSQQPGSPRSAQPLVLVEQILHTRYVVNRADLQLFLEQKFPQQSDFAIRVHTYFFFSFFLSHSPCRWLLCFFLSSWRADFQGDGFNLDKERPLDIHGSGEDY